MNHIGPYLLDSIRATEGAIEIWLAQDTITGVPALIYKPVIAELPGWRIEGVLPWTTRVADAWVAELPFGAAPLAELLGKASATELTAWARRLTVTLLEMQALGLRHGRLAPERVWVKGEQVWLEGLGLPVEGDRPDDAALVEVLRLAAGDSWPGWPFKDVMERLAEGRLSLREAAEQLVEPRSAAEMEALLDEEEEAAATEEVSTGTVRIIARSEPRPREEAAQEVGSENGGEPAERPREAEQPLFEPDEAVETVRVKPRAPGGKKAEPASGRDDAATSAEAPESARESAEVSPQGAGQHERKEPQAAQETPTIRAGEPQDEPAAAPSPAGKTPPPSPAPAGERPVVRIDEASEPAFEVIEPPARRPAGRAVFRYGVLGLTALLLLFGAIWYLHRGGGAAGGGEHEYAVEFRLEPQDAHAELVLLEAPEGSQLVSQRTLAVIPGKVYFDVPGVYRIQLRADGYLPQEKLLSIPPRSRVITVRLSR